MNKVVVVLVALYRYRNFPIRIMQSLLENIDGVECYSIFLKNCETNVIASPTKKEEKLFIDALIKLKPTIVGISVLSPFVPIAARLTKIIKESCPAFVIWGGIHPTIAPEHSIRETDMLCVGEGEGAIVELVVSLRERRSHLHIKNLWIREGNDIIKNSLRPLIQNLDSLPFPSYGNASYFFIDSNRVIRDDPLLLDDSLWIQTARGCPYSCSYCVNSVLQPLFKGLGNYSRRRSVDSLIKEIKNYLVAGREKHNHIYFVDEVFGADETWLNEFELKYKKEIGIPFTVEYNPSLINYSRLDILKNAGVDTISFGIQSGTDYIRNSIFNRHGKNKEIINLAKIIDSYNIKIKYDLIIDNPYETAQTLKDSIGFLLQLPKPLFFNLFSLQYFPDYPLTKKAIEDKYINHQDTGGNDLLERTGKRWVFIPRLFPFTRKQMLQNIIWLIVWNHTNENNVNYAIFNNSLVSQFCFLFLNCKAIILGKILGIGGFIWRNPWVMYLINGGKYTLSGDWKILFLKIKKNLKYLMNLKSLSV